MSNADRMDKAIEDGEYCDSCGYFPVHTKEYQNSRDALRSLREGTEVEKRRLCEVCAKTHIGTASEYPEQYRDQLATMLAIAWSHNRLMDEIRGKA